MKSRYKHLSASERDAIHRGRLEGRSPAAIAADLGRPRSTIAHLVQGADLPTVQRISGHKTLQMVVRYAHQNGEHIGAAMDKLEQRYRPAEQKTATVVPVGKLESRGGASR